jgi:proteasome beta subunit
MMAPDVRSFAELVGFPPESWRTQPNADTHGTTVLAVRYDAGVLMLADRRATAGNLIMFDMAEKIMALDDATLMAISGSFARALEMTRFLKHSFKYYRRAVMSPLSIEGKLMEVSRAIAGNMAAAMDGVGFFLPIVATFDGLKAEFRLHFYDGAGARFENPNYACAGSGSERIRGVFEYLARTKGAWAGRNLDDVLLDALKMLDIAADLDSATGGFQKTPPAAMMLTKDGVESVDPNRLQAAVDAVTG